MERFDIAIIGAGPAGSAAAISLTQKGYRVALIDKEKFPRDKLCGDFINPINWPVLRQLGVDDDILCSRHDKIESFLITACSGEQAQTSLLSQESQPGFGLGMRRWSFDYVLLKRAERDGAVVFQGCKVKSLQRHSQGWRFALDDSAQNAQISAQILIGADGRNSWLAHRLGLTSTAERQGRSVGFQIRLQSFDGQKGQIGIHLFPCGYAGLVALGDGTVNLGMAVERRKLPHEGQLEFLLQSCLPRNPYLRDALRRSQRIGAARATYPVYFKPRRCFDERVVFVGDAARVNEPVSGEGIYFGIKSAILAAEAIDRAFRAGDFSTARLASYDQACRQAFSLRRRLNSLLRVLIYRPALLAPLVRFSAKRARLLNFLVRAICTPEPAR
jgi:geranylgeranyl reductase family protein